MEQKKRVNRLLTDFLSKRHSAKAYSIRLDRYCSDELLLD